MSANEKITLIQYASEEEAQQAFLTFYCGETKYSRPLAIDRAGLVTRRVNAWFRDPDFFAVLEKALKKALRNKSRVREYVLNKTIALSQADLTDCLFTDPITGELSLLDLKSIPEGTRSALKKLSIGRQKIVSADGKTVYRDVLNIELMDTIGALKLLGDWAGIKEEEKKLLGDNVVRFSGLTILPPPEKKKELTHASNGIQEIEVNDGADGEVLTEPSSAGDAEEAWFSE